MSVEFACPICDERWPSRPPRCLCGYDFETGDPSRALIIIGDRMKRARRLTRIGSGVFLSIPLLWLYVSYLAPHLLLLAVLAFPLQLGIGVTLVGGGILRGARDGQRLKAARQKMQLPAARVIPR